MELFTHAGITTHEVRYAREMRGCIVGGIPMKRVDPITLQYRSGDKETAARPYNEKIKPALSKLRIRIIHHDCSSLKIKEWLRDCHNGT